MRTCDIRNDTLNFVVNYTNESSKGEEEKLHMQFNKQITLMHVRVCRYTSVIPVSLLFISFN